MRDALVSSTIGFTCDGPVRDVCNRLEKLLLEGLRHGFFEITISCKVVSSGKRELVIREGKSHLFTIREEEVPR
jgi:hypothetical protein